MKASTALPKCAGATIPLVGGMFFFALASEAAACPQCTWDRLLAEHWHLKYGLVAFFVPLLIVANRIDVVRFQFVLLPYLVFCFTLHHYLFWHTFPGDTFLAQAGWWIWGLNLVGVAMLYAVSSIPFFRWNKEKGLALWQIITYPVLTFVIGIVVR